MISGNIFFTVTSENKSMITGDSYYLKGGLMN
jgi:hypothetical protein